MSLAKISIFTILSAYLTSATYNNAPTPVPLLASRSSVLFDNSTDDATWPWHIYQTAPEAHPPFSKSSGTARPSSPALSHSPPTNATKDTAPLLMSGWGDLSLNGSDYFTYWNGYVLEGQNASIGYGNLTILDKYYEPVALVGPNLGINVQAGIPHDYDIDYNEQYLTPWGTLLVTVYNLTQIDLSSVNGSAEGYLLDAQIHEIDIATSESIWKWSALDHIHLNASQLPLTDMAANESVAWDYVHINSVSPYGTDKLLVSGRHTWDVFAIDRSSGDIVWNYNGIYGEDFGAVPEEATFSWQYHTRVHDFGENFIIFSNFGNHDYAGAIGGNAQNTAPTVGREFYLELSASKNYHPLSLNTYNESSSLFSDSWGSFDYLPNQQNATSRFMSYGQLPILREWQAGPGLNQTAFKWQATFGADNDVATYRAQKASWYGEPKTAQQLVVLQNGTAYMSWNGATHVAGWNIYSASADNSTTYTLKGIARSRGFETAVDLGVGCYMVQPLVHFSPSMNATYGVNSTRVCSS
ncbi:hypothetical protein BCON_0072g00430 [Botryotinia convoluta]|uniref:ASST-domain-containing protein n=1 Tax=Botryotinia convoluta TaxID=54673 RepID=A0A4Z1IJR1_9HELO|nr:hypothetical protein BCON_0072g00430 [Botryotinia convoluta]